MSEPTPEAQAPEAQVADDQQAAEAPPWGDDFDPEKAWKLVQNLRADKEKLSSRPALTPQQQQQLDEYNRLVEASKSEAQRQQEALEAANREAETARAEAIRYRAAATHGLSAEHFDLLGSGTEEEVSARAEKIAALLAAQAGPAPATAPQTRPVEQLRPGATPGEAESADDVLYKQLFG
jgi:hypothetical protein